MDVSIGALYRKSLSTRGKVLCDYLWCTPNSGSDLRSATKVLNFKPSSVAEVPIWTYDGAATGQESASCSVVYLKPKSLHPDPIRYTFVSSKLRVVTSSRQHKLYKLDEQHPSEVRCLYLPCAGILLLLCQLQEPIL